MFDRRYFVYMLNSASRRALYIGVTDALIPRTLEHRAAAETKSFTSQYRAFRLVYYEEFGDIDLAIAREKQLKGWSRAKKNALVAMKNPKWRDLLVEWESKYEFEFPVPAPYIAKPG